MIRNQIELQFFGLQRSGNHGVITWLLQQFDSPQYFLNNIDHFKDPFDHFRMTEVPNMIQLRRNAVQEHRLASKELLLYSYENLRLDLLATRTLVPMQEQSLGKSERHIQVLIIRDFYNWIISRLKLFQLLGQEIHLERTVDRLVKLWMLYAREYCCHTNFLDSNKVSIHFDKWVTDSSYRLELLNTMKINVRDNSNGKVPKGGGSSFKEDQGRDLASTSGVLNRWTNNDTNPLVIKTIEDRLAVEESFETLRTEVATRTQVTTDVFREKVAN